MTSVSSVLVRLMPVRKPSLLKGLYMNTTSPLVVRQTTHLDPKLDTRTILPHPCRAEEVWLLKDGFTNDMGTESPLGGDSEPAASVDGARDDMPRCWL